MEPAPAGRHVRLSDLPVEFLGSYPDPVHPLAPVLPEIALIGRSNVGKSSLINALLGKRGLARVSGSPGKTTLLNVYRLPRLYLLDLPGYGYAKASLASREDYRRLIEGCLRRRPTLTGVLWLLDARHDPSDEDSRIAGVLEERSLPVLVALTKADKLGKMARKERQRRIGAALGLSEDQILLTSSTTGLGIDELGSAVLAAAGKDT